MKKAAPKVNAVLRPNLRNNVKAYIYTLRKHLQQTTYTHLSENTPKEKEPKNFPNDMATCAVVRCMALSQTKSQSATNVVSASAYAYSPTILHGISAGLPIAVCSEVQFSASSYVIVASLRQLYCHMVQPPVLRWLCVMLRCCSTVQLVDCSSVTAHH